jgi:hypothetical protein
MEHVKSAQLIPGEVQECVFYTADIELQNLLKLDPQFSSTFRKCVRPDRTETSELTEDCVLFGENHTDHVVRSEELGRPS